MCVRVDHATVSQPTFSAPLISNTPAAIISNSNALLLASRHIDDVLTHANRRMNHTQIRISPIDNFSLIDDCLRFLNAKGNDDAQNSSKRQ